MDRTDRFGELELYAAGFKITIYDIIEDRSSRGSLLVLSEDGVDRVSETGTVTNLISLPSRYSYISSRLISPYDFINSGNRSVRKHFQSLWVKLPCIDDGYDSRFCFCVLQTGARTATRR